MEEDSRRDSHPRLDALERPPLDKRGTKHHETRHRDGNIESLCQRSIIREFNPGQQLRRDICSKTGGAGVHDDVRINAWCLLGDLGDEAVVEDVLRDGDKQRAAEGLHEHHHGGTRRDVLEWEDCLDRDQGLLHAEPDAKAVEDLIANPLLVPGGCFEGAE